jgi:hypothetical protein
LTVRGPSGVAWTPPPAAASERRDLGGRRQRYDSAQIEGELVPAERTVNAYVAAAILDHLVPIALIYRYALLRPEHDMQPCDSRKSVVEGHSYERSRRLTAA